MKKLMFLCAMLTAAWLPAEEIWSCDFQKPDDSLVMENGAKIVDGVLDCGYGDPASKAWASLKFPQTNLSSGTIFFRYRPGYDLAKRAASPKDADKRNILFIPAEGSVYTGVRLDWYNTYGAWLHFYLCSNNDDHKNLQTGLHSSNPKMNTFNTKAKVWKEVLVSWTQTSAKMWVDGKLASERSLEDAPAMGLPLGQIYFGAANVRGMQLVSGDMQISCVKVWNTAETPESLSGKTGAPAQK